MQLREKIAQQLLQQTKTTQDKKTMKHTSKNTIKHGFSLVEMLVVIAVIGIIAAIAIPSIATVNAAATKAEQQRNAQTICSIFNAGQSAGCAWVTTSLTALFTDMTTGKTPASGPFSTQIFKLPAISTMSAADVTGVQSHLAIDASTTPNGLNYTP